MKVVAEEKECLICKTIKPLVSFHKHGATRTRRSPYCSDCANKKARDWTAANSHRDDYKKRKRANYYKHKYNLSIEQVEEIFDNQNGCCDICRKQLHKGFQGFDVDHCHKTGKIRGILCNNCNKAIGGLQESVENLKSAILYLEKYS